MIRYLAVSALAVSLSACTLAQQTSAQKYQDMIAGACTSALALVPTTSVYRPWIDAGCVSEAAVAKLALDPNTLLWINDIIKRARAL